MYAKDVFKQIEKQEMDADAVIDPAGIKKARDSFADEDELGKQLFEIAAACRGKKIDPESALRRYAQRVVDQLEQE
jgi:hypothetical protein